jgi:hypothetical protein
MMGDRHPSPQIELPAAILPASPPAFPQPSPLAMKAEPVPRANQYHAIWRGSGVLRQPGQSGTGAGGAEREGKAGIGEGRAQVGRECFVPPANENARETALRPDEILTEIIVPAAAMKALQGQRMRWIGPWPPPAWCSDESSTVSSRVVLVRRQTLG